MSVEPPNAAIEPITFLSGDVPVVGDLHLPEVQPLGIGVLSGPLTSVRRQATDAYARALASRGYAALTFDHRYFGDSGGLPRQFENPFAKVEDIRAAATALRASPGLAGLPLFAIGICAGAGYMARAVAADRRFKGFVGIAGVYGVASEAAIAAAAIRIARGQAAEDAWRDTGIAETIPAVAPDNGDVAMPLDEAYEYYGTPRGIRPGYVNGFAVQSLAYTSIFDSQGAAEEIEAPALVIHSERALAPALARAFVSRLKIPTATHWLESQGQIDFYDDPLLINQVTDLATAFLGSVIPPAISLPTRDVNSPDLPIDGASTVRTHLDGACTGD